MTILSAAAACLDGGDDDLHGGELAVNAEAEEHQEEGDRPDLGPRHLGQCVREHNKHQSRSVSHHILLNSGTI